MNSPVSLKAGLRRAAECVTHSIGRLTRRYYFEDFVRVYPGGIVYNRLGRKHRASENECNNFLNHVKFYRFAAQFVSDKRVADVGCGTGYGCELMKRAGAAEVHGCDVSRQALRFAESHYRGIASFSRQSITDLKKYPREFFQVVICSEVLEHIKEYQMEERAVCELRRITQKDGLIILGTPNTELMPNHGFSFEEVDRLLKKGFTHYCIFENALVPFGPQKALWESRLASGEKGIIVSENIDFSETVLPERSDPEVKRGVEPGTLQFGPHNVDTKLLHNTHSWVILAIAD